MTSRTSAAVRAFGMAALLGSGGSSAGLAHAAGVERLVRMVAPRTDAFVTGRVVRVEVETREPLARLIAFAPKAERPDVTDRFRRVGRRYVARLRVGHELVSGRNNLFVRARSAAGAEDVVSSDFTVGTDRADLLEMRGPRHGPSAPATVALQVHETAGEFEARLNGRNVRATFERAGSDGAWRADLTVHDGLRFGENRVVVTGFTSDGRYQRVRRTFTVRQEAPLVDAGRDRTTRVGSTLCLNGGATAPVASGGPLAMRWRIVDQPAGANPGLAGARTARPCFSPDVRGVYTLALRASQPERPSRTIASPSPGPSIRPAPVDTVTVAVQANAPPSGVPVETIASNFLPGIFLGQDFYLAFLPGNAPLGVQMLVLDRQTLAETQNTTYPPTDAGVSQLGQAVAALSPADLVILTGGGRPLTLSAAGQNALAAVLTSVGASIPLAVDASQQLVPNVGALVSGQWSVIGVPELPQGTAYQLIGVRQGANAVPGAMSGVFQIDSSANYTFTWSLSYQTFDTQAPGSTATSNVIAVNSQTYPSPSLPSGQSGVQIVWLDADTLDLRASYTFVNAGPTSGGECPDPGPPACLWEFVKWPPFEVPVKVFASQIGAIAADPTPAMLLITTFGNANVQDAWPSWNVLATWLAGLPTLGISDLELPGFGANAQVILGLDGSGDYSFVGVNGLGLLGPNQGAELSQPLTGLPSPRLTGVFHRNRQGLWVPRAFGSPAPGEAATVAQPDLERLLAEPPQAFPAFTGVAEAAAEQYVANKLAVTPDPQYGIRGLYWLDDSIDWNSKFDELSDGVTVPPCKTFPCREGFAAVRNQLLVEFPMVATVRNYFTVSGVSNLFGLLEEEFILGNVSFTATALDVLQFYNVEPVKPQGDDPLKILTGSLTIGSGFAGVIPGYGGLVSAPFKIGAGVSAIVDATTNNASGLPAFNPTAFENFMEEFGQGIATAWGDALDNLSHVADLLVSDYGLLQAANLLIGTASSDSVSIGGNSYSGWGLDTDSQSAFQQVLALSIGQYIWSSMLSVPVLARYSWSNPESGGVPAADVFTLPTPFVIPGANGSTLCQWYWWLYNGTAHAREPTPNAQVLAQLFDSPSEGGLGFQAPYLLAPALTDTPGGNRITPGFSQVQVSGDGCELCACQLYFGP